MRIILFIITCFLFSSCTLSQEMHKAHFFIPKDYTGWVNIIFDDSTSSNEQFTFSDEIVFLINKNPEEFRVRSKVIPSGKYSDNYYYYNLDTVMHLKELDYPMNNIFFSQFIILHEIDEKGKMKAKPVYSFYVSKELLNVDSLSVDRLPKNRILK
jgi:hypothetical protein